MELVNRMMEGLLGRTPEEDYAQDAPVRLGQDEKMTYLQRVQLFESCSTRQLRSIARIAEVQEAPVGTVMARIGEPGDRFFVLVDGSARIEVTAEKQLRIGPGGFFGEMSLLDGEPRSATVVADTAVRLLVIHRRDFMTLLREVPALTQRMLVTLCQRVRVAEKALNA